MKNHKIALYWTWLSYRLETVTEGASAIRTERDFPSEKVVGLRGRRVG